MELHEFVSKTLVQIIRGVEQAQMEIVDSQAKVSPQLRTAFTNTQTGGTNQGLGWAQEGGLVSVVEFNVSVSAQEGQGTKGGIGVVTGIFALGSQASSDKASTAATRIQFGVPIKLPTT